MGTRVELVKITVPYTWKGAPAVVAGWQARLRSGVDVVAFGLARRQVRELRAMVTVPLAIAASVMSGLWVLVPALIVCAWWWAPSARGWEWLEAVGRGVLTIEWGLIGAGALAAFPTARLAVLWLWIALPLALAGG